MWSYVEVLGFGVMDDDGAGGLLGVDLPIFGEVAADAGGVEQREEFFLVLQVGAGGVAEGVARAAVFLGEEAFDFGAVICGDAQFLSHALVPELGEGFGGFDGEAVEVEIVGVVVGLEEFLCFFGGAGADGDAVHADDVDFSAGDGTEEVGDAEVAGGLLAREGEAEEFG